VTSYDAELQRHNEVLRQACGVQFRDNVLDIGCGSGQTTREAARTARAGSALGVDAAMAWVRGFAYTREILRQLDPTAAERAVGRLREALATHFTDDGVWFNSRAWVVTAHRR
jgi:SAM-dependent methyltransferase